MRISSIAALLLIGTTVMMAGVMRTNTFYGEDAGMTFFEGDGSGDDNSFFGYKAGYYNTSDNNTFIGSSSGYNNTTGFSNTFIGQVSGWSNTVGSYNTFIGYLSGFANIGNYNTFSGSGSGTTNTTGHSNNFMGYQGGFRNTTGYQNTFIGDKSGFENREGFFNTYIGAESGYLNGYQSIAVHHNTFSGAGSGFSNMNGNYNTFIGKSSGAANTDGNSNTFIGYVSGFRNIDGNYNTFIGDGSGPNADAGISKSVFLGNDAGYNATRSNTFYIDNSSTETPLIYGEFDNDLVRINGKLEGTWAGSNTEGDGLTNLLVLSANNSEADKESDAGFGLKNARADMQWNFRTHQNGTAFVATRAGTGGPEFTVKNDTGNVSGTALYLGNGAKCVNGVWINSSSRTSKENIKALSSEDALTAFRKLQPITYNYKTDKTESYVGFIAEDVPELVAINSRDGLSSMDIVAVLTKVVQEQEKNNEVLQQKVGDQEQQLTATKTELQVKDAEIKVRNQKIATMEAQVAKLETMQKKVAQLESILTNLALDSSNTKKEKVSVSLK